MHFNTSSQNERTYDAIVVGTGISGGWAAMELCRKGLKTLVLERGRMLQHGDYPYASLNDWEIEYNNLLPRSVKQKHYYKLSRKDYIARQSDVPFFCKDDEYPYTEKRRFDWIRGYQVGGRSITWGRQTYRLGDLDFEANLRDGIAVDWPIRYADLKPWYDYVERFVGVSGQNEGLSHFPDGNYLPAMPLNCVEEDFKVAVGKRLNRLVTPGRAAHLTAYDPKIHLGPRGNCQYRDRCRRGCPFGGYFSSLSSTLPVAEETGNLTLRADSAVKQLLVDPAERRATGVLVRDTQTGEDLEFFSRGPVFLCASALNSTAILLNTTDSNHYPDGLGNSSGQLGRNLMDHHHRIGAYADFDGHNDKYTKGRKPNGFYIPRFVNLKNKDSQRDYLRGFGYQGGGSRSNWMRAVRELDTTIGPELKEKMLSPGGWRMGMTAFGESLPNPDNRITLNHDLLDKDGLPTLIMDAAFGENEKAMRKEMKSAAAEMLEAAGGKNVGTYATEAHPGFSIHEMGTARMGRNPKTSVLNAHNQVWDCPNVYVTDGAAMTSAGCVNPSNTYMALTARAVAHATKG